MLEFVLDKIRKYKVTIIPATLYELLDDGERKLVQRSPQIEKRFITYRQFDRYVKRLEHKNDPVPIKISHLKDSFTYFAIPDLTYQREGDFEQEIEERFSVYFD